MFDQRTPEATLVNLNSILVLMTLYELFCGSILLASGSISQAISESATCLIVNDT